MTILELVESMIKGYVIAMAVFGQLYILPYARRSWRIWRVWKRQKR